MIYRGHEDMTGSDFSAHNEKVVSLWESYHAQRPRRVPVIFGINPRFILLDPKLNDNAVTFERYSSDPEVMLDIQLKTAEYIRLNIPQDAPMGLPERWNVSVDLQNYYEAAYLGAPVRFSEGAVPVAEKFLTDQNKYELLEKGPVDPHKTPLGRKMREIYYYMLARREEGFLYRGRPLGEVVPRGLGTDGPFTLFVSLRGESALVDMYIEPEYFHRMMAFLTDFIISDIRATRRLAGRQERPESFDFADDSIELLGASDYREHVLPYHRRLIDELAGAGPHSMHICGDVQRHFPTLKAELGIRSIDTGFPIDWSTLRDEVGDDVEIYGGVHADMLRRAGPERITAEVERILGSGIMRGGRFVLREANNLAPGTPLANLHAMYEAAREYGRYS